jgi:hypothetical protein
MIVNIYVNMGGENAAKKGAFGHHGQMVMRKKSRQEW